MTMITPSYLGETIEYSSLHACRSTLEDPTRKQPRNTIKAPNVSVIVKEVNAPKFSVLGYVTKPGTYPLRGDLSVLQALSQAGGFTPFASPRKIKIIRNVQGKQESRRVNYYDLIAGRGGENYLLKPGDTIVVP